MNQKMFHSLFKFYSTLPQFLKKQTDKKKYIETNQLTNALGTFLFFFCQIYFFFFPVGGHPDTLLLCDGCLLWSLLGGLFFRSFLLELKVNGGTSCKLLVVYKSTKRAKMSIWAIFILADSSEQISSHISNYSHITSHSCKYCKNRNKYKILNLLTDFL